LSAIGLGRVFAHHEVATIDLLDTGVRGGPPPENVDEQTFDIEVDD
jgi:hypothetical protein